MKSQEAALPQAEAVSGRGRFFTVPEANSALVLVRRIVRDIVDRQAELMRLRDQVEELGEALGATETVAGLRWRAERLTTALNRLHAELIEVGCELKDWTVGLVDFPALHEGREVSLCWRCDEESVGFWHERDGGFAGRRPVAADF